MATYCQLYPKEHFLLDFVWSSNVFIQENASENMVCETAGILFRLQYVDKSFVIV